jgi:hypothetical protein
MHLLEPGNDRLIANRNIAEDYFEEHTTWHSGEVVFLSLGFEVSTTSTIHLYRNSTSTPNYIYGSANDSIEALLGDYLGIIVAIPWQPIDENSDYTGVDQFTLIDDLWDLYQDPYVVGIAIENFLLLGDVNAPFYGQSDTTVIDDRHVVENYLIWDGSYLDTNAVMQSLTSGDYILKLHGDVAYNPYIYLPFHYEGEDDPNSTGYKYFQMETLAEGRLISYESYLDSSVIHGSGMQNANESVMIAVGLSHSQTASLRLHSFQGTFPNTGLAGLNNIGTYLGTLVGWTYTGHIGFDIEGKPYNIPVSSEQLRNEVSSVMNGSPVLLQDVQVYGHTGEEFIPQLLGLGFIPAPPHPDFVHNVFGWTGQYQTPQGQIVSLEPDAAYILLLDPTHSNYYSYLSFNVEAELPPPTEGQQAR